MKTFKKNGCIFTSKDTLEAFPSMAEEMPGLLKSYFIKTSFGKHLPDFNAHLNLTWVWEEKDTPSL